jgi:pimeloyl-ACP methyl ester carboxylesterase
VGAFGGVRGPFRRRTAPAQIDSMTAAEATAADDALALDDAIPDIDWRALPPGTRSESFPAPSGNLARIGLGAPGAPRVVLIPGVTGSKEDFTLMLPLLADAGYRVESFDLAGQYESTAAGPEHLDPPRAHYDHDLFIDDLIAILEDGSSPVHVLGYSFAGTVAQLALLQRPDLFASLTLLSCPPLSGQAFRGVKRIGRFSSVAPPRTGASLLMWGVRNNLNRVPPGRLAFVRERFALTRRQSVDDIIALMMATPDTRAVVRAARIPKLVAVGSRDLWATGLHAAFARDIGAGFAVYDTGHSPCETAPHQLVRDLLEQYARADD